MNSKSHLPAKSDGEATTRRPILAPSRFGSLASKSADSPSAQPEVRSTFPVLKASKLSSVTKSLSTPSSPPSNQQTENGNKTDESTAPTKPSPPVEAAKATTSPVRFVPLSKEFNSESEKAPSGPEVAAPITEPKATEPASEPTSDSFIFGENLRNRASNFSQPISSDGVSEKKSPLKTAKHEVDNSLTSSNTAGDSGGDGFVFGQNLQERAQNFVTPPPESSSSAQNHDKEDGAGEKEKTLSESAAEWSEAHALKRKYDEVAIVTGEEGETNVIRVNAKLHVFDKSTTSWIERGRGSLHLNDFDDVKSRLVMRTGGSLRVILNTKLFPAMSIEMPSEKSIRLTGLEGEAVKIFLITGTTKDICRLYSALEARLAKIKTDDNSKKFKSQD